MLPKAIDSLIVYASSLISPTVAVADHFTSPTDFVAGVFTSPTSTPSGNSSSLVYNTSCVSLSFSVQKVSWVSGSSTDHKTSGTSATAWYQSHISSIESIIVPRKIEGLELSASLDQWEPVNPL